jgi:hypothetical protein
MRLAFNGPEGWFATAASPVTAFSGWSHQVFDIRSAALASAGGVNAAATLAAVSELRIHHSAAVDYREATVSSSFMMDHIQAIPEPSAVMVLSGLASFVFILRKR